MKNYFGLLLLTIAMLMVSCNKQEIDQSVTNNILIIHVNNCNYVTRTVPTSDPKAVENTVNNVTIGVFKADGTVKTIKEFNSISSKTISMRVANLSTTDKVLCAVNTTSGTFASVRNTSDFNNIELNLDKALTTNTVDIIANNLPMYGEGTIKGSGDTYTSDVDIYHLNTKVSLNSFGVALANNGTFTPKEIFLMNVPSSFKFNYNNPYSSNSYYHGSLNSQVSGESQKLYLGYGNINSTIDKLYFYTSPNNSTKYTKLVIYGVFDADGNGPIQPKNTYYPIIIDKTLLSNKNYILNVIVRGQGVDNVTDDLDYSNLNVTLNINNFEDVTKNISLD